MYNVGFPINEKCYEDDSIKWNELQISAKSHPDDNSTGVLFEVRIEECVIGCSWDVLTSVSSSAIFFLTKLRYGCKKL